MITAENNIVIRNEPAIICDLDGTLALKHDERTWHDASTCDEDVINMPILEICSAFAKTHHIIFCSGREDKYREQTMTFLKRCFPSYIDRHDFSLFMRNTKDYRKDSIVKYEIYNNCIINRWDVLFVLDDRNQVVDMWRNTLNLPCLQVAEGDF
tara:strand:+ start:74 stop:535 length:462 start_codon:yes stop_codon:yes gene_type:complete